MITESVSQQKPAWPRSSAQQRLEVCEQSGHHLRNPENKRVNRPRSDGTPLRGNHAVLFAQVEQCNGRCGESVAPNVLSCFAPVRVSDHTMDHCIERAGTPLHGLFEQVSAWLRKRLARLLFPLELCHCLLITTDMGEN